VIGYRTKCSPVICGSEYEVGETYEATVFSVCPLTDCHPGLYLAPTLKLVGRTGPYIKVKALARDVHKTPEKWRCRKFEVLEELR
jgi:hypothetical protein